MKGKPNAAGDDLQKALQDLARGGLPPCYLICGADEFLVRDAQEQLVSALLPPADRDLNLFTLDGDEVDNPDSLCETLLTSPLLPGRKVVLVRGATFFHSRQTAADLVRRVRDHLEGNPLRAGRDFMTFLAVAGWKLDDLRDDGWRRISDDAWNDLVEGDAGQDRSGWLPRVVALCIEKGLDRKGAAGGDGEQLIRTLSGGLPEGHCLIVTAAGADKRKRLFKAMSDLGVVIAFPDTKAQGRERQPLVAASRSLLAASGKTLTEEAWTLLGEKTGFDIRNGMAALEKLIVYAGPRTEIDEGDVASLVGKTREDTVFNLTNALAEKDLPACLAILDELLVRGTPPIMILAMIAREIRLLLQARLLILQGTLEGFDARMTYPAFQSRIHPQVKAVAARIGDGIYPLDIAGLHPFVQYNVFRHAARFSRDTLTACLEALARADILLKTSGRNPRLLLERILLQATERQAEGAGRQAP